MNRKNQMTEKPNFSSDFCLTGENLDKKLSYYSNIFSQKTKWDLKESLKVENSNPKEKISLMFALFNTFYTQTHSDNKSLLFAQSLFDKEKCLIDKMLKLFSIELLKNFPDDDILEPRVNFNLASAIIHCFAIITGYSTYENGLVSLFFEKGGKLINDLDSSGKNKLWICAEDNEEFETLNSIKDLHYVSYSELEIRQFVAFGLPFEDGFSLFKCSNECNHYYTVGQCTKTVPNNMTKCSKGHLLMGPVYGQLYTRDGHMKIENPTKFIKNKLSKLSETAPKGFRIKNAVNNQNGFTVRSLKPITYRILHFILHSNLYMLASLDICDKYVIKSLMHLKEKFSLMSYLKSNLEEDFKVIAELSGVNNVHFLIHAVLFNLPRFFEENSIAGSNIKDRNDFEINFETQIVNPLMKNINQTMAQFESVFSKKNLGREISIKSKTLSEPKKLYLEILEERFKEENASLAKYEMIKLYLKHKERLDKLSALQVLMKIILFLFDKFQFSLSRKEATSLKLVECFDKTAPIFNDYLRLKQLWNKHLKIDLMDYCVEYKGVEINEDTSVALLLVDDRPEIGSGIQTRLILQYLIASQNLILSEALKIQGKMMLTQYIVSTAKETNFINLELKKFEQLIKPLFSTKHGTQTGLDYKKIEKILEKNLIDDKLMLSPHIIYLPKMIYSEEIFANNCYLFDDLRLRVAQTRIDEDKLKNIKIFANKIDSKKKKSIWKYLGFIVYVAGVRTANPDSNLSLKEFIKNTKKMEGRELIQKSEEISGLKLRNLIEIYEIFEDLVFNQSFNEFDDKYKKNLPSKLDTEFRNFMSKCDGVALPSKLEFNQAMKRFSMRCLLADLNEETQLLAYLSNSRDFWPENAFNKAYNLNFYMPRDILVKHSLGNMFCESSSKSSENFVFIFVFIFILVLLFSFLDLFNFRRENI